MPKAPISIICAKVKSNKVGTIGITIERAIMFEMGTTTAITTSTEVTMVTIMIGMRPMFLLKIASLLLGRVEVVWHELRICCTK